jgi:hypothetical protein
MLMAIRSAVVVFLLVGCGLSRYGSAGGAWVMWVRAAPATNSGEVVGAWTSWATYGAYTTRAGCMAYVPDGLPQVKDVAQQATGLVTEGYVRAQFQCLPATIDPSGPKGN